MNLALFWSKVSKSEGCWLWIGRRNRNGYGVFTIGHSGKVLAHRQSWALAYGKVPDGMFVLHRCDTPGCVNPEHLFLGTQSDNVRDMHSKGRARNQFSGVEREITCGHQDRKFFAFGMCHKCYMRDYHRKRREASCQASQ